MNGSRWRSEPSADQIEIAMAIEDELEAMVTNRCFGGLCRLIFGVPWYRQYGVCWRWWWSGGGGATNRPGLFCLWEGRGGLNKAGGKPGFHE